MSLKEYNKKRDFKKTPEPSVYARNNREAKNKKSERGHEQKPEIKKSSSRKLKYSIQEHHASHLHWDLRLEHEGVLLSWAIPKSPSELKGKKVKRLAVQTEDHPLDYWNFEGKIPEGNYGAGKVKLWDKGTYELIKKTPKEIEIEIHGKKLEGKYVLIKTHYGKTSEQKKKSWLIFKI